MSDIHDELERLRKRQPPPEKAFERLAARRRTLQLRRCVGAGILAIAIAGAGYEVLARAFDGRRTVPAQPPSSACTITGTQGDDVLRGTPGNDVICGLGGHDTLFAGGGDDILRGGSGNDVLNPEGGNDLVVGGAGHDLVSYGGSQVGVVVDLERGTATGQGSDRLLSLEGAVGGIGDDILLGDAAANLLRGDYGDDSLRGNGGNDKLVAGGGDDSLSGQAGSDFLNGGAGNDHCRQGSGSGKRVNCE